MRRTSLLLFIFSISIAATNAQVVDSLYDAYTQSKGKERRVIGTEIIAYLDKQEFEIDSLLYDETLQDNTFDLLLTKNVTRYLFRNDRFEQAFKAAETLVNLSEEAADSALLIDGYYFMGFSSQKMGKMDDGLKYGLKCYELCKTLNNEEMLSSTLNNLGNIYLVNNDNRMAAIYFAESIDIERRLGRKQNLAIRLGNIASAYLKQGKLQEALSAVTEGLELDRETGRPDKLAIRTHQMAQVYIAMGEYDKAMEYETEALEFFKTEQRGFGQATVLFSMAEIEERMNRPQQAESHLEEALAISEGIGNNLFIQQICEKLYQINKTKNPAKSLAFLERYTCLVLK